MATGGDMVATPVATERRGKETASFLKIYIYLLFCRHCCHLQKLTEKEQTTILYGL